MSRTGMHRLTLVAALVLVTACGAPTSATTVGPGGATTPAPARGAIAPFTPAPCPTPNVAGFPQLDLDPGFSCGYLTVPENRARQDGPTIRIAVATIKAASATPKPDPVVWLTGGPGGTAIATANRAVAKGVNADRDVIFVDQRGTLHAQPPLICPEIDAFQREAIGLPTSDPATAVKSDVATRTCRDRLTDQGIDLAAYDTIQNAADIADLRVALGVEQWNVRGVSYGTDLALQLLRDHPQGIRSVVLDSVLPPQLNLIDGLWPSAAAGYRALFDACAAQPTCAEAYPDLRAEFAAAVRRLDAQPLTARVPDPTGGPAITVLLDGYKLANLLNVLALNPGSLTKAPAILHAVATGDPVPAAQAYLQTISPPGLNGFGLQFGVVCREHTAFTNPGEVQAEAKRALPEFPDRVLALPPQVPRVFQDCAIWNAGRADAAAARSARSDIPALLLSGTLDGITPPEWADTAAGGLTNSQVLRFPGAGHDVIQWNDCAISVMLSFLDNPTGNYDTVCVQQVQAPMFTTPPKQTTTKPVPGGKPGTILTPTPEIPGVKPEPSPPEPTEIPGVSPVPTLAPSSPSANGGTTRSAEQGHST